VTNYNKDYYDDDANVKCTASWVSIHRPAICGRILQTTSLL